MTHFLNFMERLFRNIKNFFKDMPQEQEWKYLPIIKLPPNVTIDMEKLPMKEKLSFFKNELVEERSKLMHPEVIKIMYEMITWVFHVHEINPVITETVTTREEDKFLGRKSSTHNEGRAFDMRTRDWTKAQITQFREYFNKLYGHLGALTTKNEPILIVHHDAGHGPHFHVQFNRDFTVQQNLTKGKLG